MVINPIVGVYIPIIRIPIKGEMTIPNIGSLDPGTYIRYPTSNARTSYLDPTSLLLDLLDKDSEKQLQDFYM